MSSSTFARRLILEMLKEAKPFALPERELVARVDARVGKPLGVSAFTVNIGWLWEHQMVAKLDGDLGDKEVRWVITRAGLAELSS